MAIEAEVIKTSLKWKCIHDQTFSDPKIDVLITFVVSAAWTGDLKINPNNGQRDNATGLCR